MATINGTDGHDPITGTSGKDQVKGGAGDNSVAAGDGADTILGGSGNDILIGGASDDRIDGDAGDDVIVGRNDTNAFVFGDGIGKKKILDFQLDRDTIEISSSFITTYDDIVARLSLVLESAILTLDDGSTLMIEGIRPADLSGAHFKIVGPVCFALGTMIQTPKGECPIEDLAVGTLVTTLDNGPMPVRWIGRRGHRFSKEPHKHKPIEIAARSLGFGLPKRRLHLSPQHRVILDTPCIQRHFDTDEVLAPAKALIGQRGVRQMNGKRDVEYITLMFDAHQIIFAEGLPCESFYPTPYALSTLPPYQRQKLFETFPGLESDPASYGANARLALTVGQTQALKRDLKTDLSLGVPLPADPDWSSPGQAVHANAGLRLVSDNPAISKRPVPKPQQWHTLT